MNEIERRTGHKIAPAAPGRERELPPGLLRRPPGERKRYHGGSPVVTPMAGESGNSFESIESAQEFVDLLAQTIEEARTEIQAQIDEPENPHDDARRKEALQLVAYKLESLAQHMGTSRRILNDLRTLRRLLLEERLPHDSRTRTAESG